MADISEYKIIKEGEAEILMHAQNEVFYNKAQVPKSPLFIMLLEFHALDDFIFVIQIRFWFEVSLCLRQPFIEKRP